MRQASSHAQKTSLFSKGQLALCFMENSCDALVGVDRDGTIQSWNPSAKAAYGYDPSEVLGKGMEILFANDNGMDGRTIAKLKLSAGVPVHGWETKLLHKNGSNVHVSIDIWPLLDNGALVGACMSVRETGKYRMLQSQLRQAQKLEAMGRLSGGIAHDFNNLLIVISGYIGMIQLKLPVGSETWGWSMEIEKAAERATMLTSQLLAFNRREVMQPRVLNLNEVVQDLVTMLRRIVGEGIGIVLALEPSLDNIKADPGQISQVLTNLVVNARDAMSRGGTLTIGSENAYLDANQEQDLAPGPYVRLTVRDNGSGMDPETQQHLFEPFFTTKPKGKGTGLGLSIVYGIVSELRGCIAVSSQLQAGTTFAIHLPATAEIQAERRVAPAKVGQQHPEIAVLLVEDDRDVRHLVREMLLNRHYTVYDTQDPQEAIRICEKTHVDLLLTDIVMPGMDGRDLAERVVHCMGPLHVLFMSGYMDDSILPANCLEPGFNFIRKPFLESYLDERISAVLKQAGQIAAPCAL